MVMDYGLNEGGDRGDVTRVEDVVGCIMTHLSGGGTEGRLGAADNDDPLALRDEIFCHCAAQAATATVTGDYGGIERREDRWSHFWYRLKACELEKLASLNMASLPVTYSKIQRIALALHSA